MSLLIIFFINDLHAGLISTYSENTASTPI